MFCTTFLACEKEEEPITPYDRGDIIEAAVNLGTDYGKQVWFDLNTNRVVKQNDKTAWDIAFSCTDSLHYIMLNSSKFMKACNTSQSDFSAITDITNASWRYDSDTGNPDSTAINHSWQNNNVYIIDRGFDALGNAIGFQKITFELLDNETYFIHYADLNGSNEHSIQIKKNETHYFKYFSFDTHIEEDIAPQKNEYDLVFTQYTEIFHSPHPAIPHNFTPPFPYLVTGVLINHSEVKVALSKEESFSKIAVMDSLAYTFDMSMNAIGWDWKIYDFTNGSGGLYTIIPNKNFIIRDTDGFYYKFRFVGFYDTQTGEKGTPNFEFQKL
ncbi:MAG: HmuY family protein [Chitinophagales bacterium]